MKWILLLICTALFCTQSNAQENEPASPQWEQEMENLTEKQDAQTKDDAYWQQLNERQKNKLNLNTAAEDELDELQLLTALQVESFLHYRELFGSFINIYELQAIPSWDVKTIRSLLPYVFVGDTTSLISTFSQRLHGGENSLIARFGQQMEKSKGFETPVDSTASHYLGGPQQLFFRYKYNFKNQLQYGLLGDKDAGEQFFRGRQKYGFDFYSFHLYAKNIGIIKSIAIGDFAVNLGQGLIQWQSLAFTKSADVLSIKRQSPVLLPYNSAGEFNFHRGGGITIDKGNFETTAFISYKNTSANLVADPVNKTPYVSSFETSGYHRTAAENADRNDLRQFVFGGNMRVSGRNYRLGINAIHYAFSYPFRKQDQPYNLFALQGRYWSNESIDYSFTWSNLHFFGETALDKNAHAAIVNGLLLSMSTTVDIALLYRKIDRAYQSLYANAFTENTTANNETGFYGGLSFHPSQVWQLAAYADVYKFPWLKYDVDAPSSGRDYFLQINYQPDKTWNIYTRFKDESKQSDNTNAGGTTYPVYFRSLKDLRVEYAIHLNREIQCRNRLETVWYNNKRPDDEQGFLEAIDFFYKPSKKPLKGNIRFQYFQTNGYNSRIYVYEEDVLYNYSIPFFYGEGIRYYVNLNWDFKKKFQRNKPSQKNVQCYLRWAQTIYRNTNSIGSGLDVINGNKKSELQMQVNFQW